jgi:hypothetical protein
MLTKPQLIKAIITGAMTEVWKECQRYGVRLSRVDWAEETGHYQGANTWEQFQHHGLIVTIELIRGEVRSIETAPV